MFCVPPPPTTTTKEASLKALVVAVRRPFRSSRGGDAPLCHRGIEFRGLQSGGWGDVGGGCSDFCFSVFFFMTLTVIFAYCGDFDIGFGLFCVLFYVPYVTYV